MIPDFSKDSLTTAQLAGLLGRSEKALRDWRSRRFGPPWYQLGGRVVYLKADVERWIAEQRRSPRQRLRA